MSKIISVYNRKGGVAKTTSALFLGLALAKVGKVLLIDMDAQESLTRRFIPNGTDLEKKTIAELLTGDVTASEAARNMRENLDIIPTQDDLSATLFHLGDSVELKLFEKLKPVRDVYDFIIIDCPPDLGMATKQAIAISNIILTPLPPEVQAIEAMNKFTQFINGEVAQGLRLETNTTYDGQYILPVMVEGNRKIQDLIMAQIKGHFKNVLPEIKRRTEVQQLVTIPNNPNFDKGDTFKDYQQAAEAMLKLEKV